MTGAGLTTDQRATCRALATLYGVIGVPYAILALLLFPLCHWLDSRFTRRPAEPWAPLAQWLALCNSLPKLAAWLEGRCAQATSSPK